MEKIDLNSIIFKPIPISRIIIAIDRLTRFKHPEEKYVRVFKDILINYLKFPKFKKVELDCMDYFIMTNIATYILNKSIDLLSNNYTQFDNNINLKIADYEQKVFIVDNDTKYLLNNKINYNMLIPLIPDDCVNNLKWLKELAISNNPDNTSLLKGYNFPVRKVIICEGLTEEILLPEFSSYLDYNFEKNGIHIISAGGKNQVVKYYYDLIDKLKIPIFVLLDNDAKENGQKILKKLRRIDNLYIIKHGEFEDILPVQLIERALKQSIKNISRSPMKRYTSSDSAVKYLEEFYKTRGVHEFKKAEFAHIVKANITSAKDASKEIIEIINEIKIL